MNYFLAAFSGLLAALMTVSNGALSQRIGTYPATAVIHTVGFLAALVAITVQKEWKKYPRQSVFCYLGGVFGFCLIMFGNLAFSRISVSALSAIMLLGQICLSLLMDNYGWLGTKKMPFNTSKLVGIGVVAVGIVVMLTVNEGGTTMISGVIFALASGMFAIISRTANARLAERTSVMNGVFWNYAFGWPTALLAFLVAGGIQPANTEAPGGLWIYIGGALGLGVLFINNVVIRKISVFYMTVLVFCGQTFTSLLVDTLRDGKFSLGLFAGALLAVIGLILVALVDKRKMVHVQNKSN